MNFKRSPFAIQNKNEKDLDYANDHPTIPDLTKTESQNDDSYTVHHRRDLDSWLEFNGYLAINFNNY